ncbi:40S ribosomal S12-like protein [Daphnia magna]|uniref:40S ribosomal S12-like protein n=1 Tax=Daphnia magna TaxID=35525 RepID=A0A162CCG1_9CRUS|nr:40S ribosomal S12-like protein [Daphnia magna]
MEALYFTASYLKFQIEVTNWLKSTASICHVLYHVVCNWNILEKVASNCQKGIPGVLGQYSDSDIYRNPSTQKIARMYIHRRKKPNSANQKCVVVTLNNGKEMRAYINVTIFNYIILLFSIELTPCFIFKEDNIGLVCVSHVIDLPGFKLK